MYICKVLDSWKEHFSILYITNHPGLFLVLVRFWPASDSCEAQYLVQSIKIDLEIHLIKYVHVENELGLDYFLMR